MLAQRVTGLHEKVVGTIVVRNGSLLGAYAKPHIPLPQQSKLSELIVQAELVLSISRRNTNIFGNVNYAMIQHSILNIFLFPLDQDSTLAFAVDGRSGIDYHHEEIINRVLTMLKPFIG
jgi:hypothetical protein